MACPDDAKIRAYATGTLPPKDRWVQGHVTGCPTCAAKLFTAPPRHVSPAPPKNESLPKGAAIGRYIVQGELGEGGMGKVYAALDPELDRKVALKLLHDGADGSSSGSGGEARLLREAQAMARLSHPNVVGVFDVGRHEGRVFVAMELVDGINLKQWLAEPRDWRAVLEVFAEAGKGLAAAHAKGLLHRDFKPPNVLIGGDGRVRVGDFGIARAVDTPDPSQVAPQHPLSTAITKTNSVVGTFGYVAPEVMLGDTVDARADQFSFAVSLWEALYGARPYPGRSYSDYYASLVSGPPVDAPRPPAWLFKVVRRGLAMRATDRYAQMTELLVALEPPNGLFGSLFKR